MSMATRDVQPAIVTLEDTTALNAFGGVVTTLRGEHTGGKFSLVVFTLEATSDGPESHFHWAIDEIYHVLEGTLTMVIDGDERIAPAGSSVFVPRGVVHTFANQSSAPVRFVLMMSPGGFERCFDDLAEARASNGELTPEVFVEITEKYDVVFPENA